VGLLDDRSVIVAGGASGIGQAVAQLATREGAKVLAVDIDEVGLEKTHELIGKEGGVPLTQVCDITDRGQVDAAVARVVSEYGTIDVVVSAAMIIKVGPLEDQSAEDLQRALDVNLVGPFHFMQAAFPYMRDRGGRIINFASGSGTSGIPTHSTYATAKEALRGLTKAAAHEWGRYEITVNCVMPMAATPSFHGALEQMPERSMEQVISAHPMQRVGDALLDIAPVVVFLASEGARYINGRSIFVDGGIGGFM
jgi:NAD(P)-dependent dehydrogenase (short-subunit alcohol dehydrogenase family)